jgi:magnesium transporter
MQRIISYSKDGIIREENSISAIRTTVNNHDRYIDAFHESDKAIHQYNLWIDVTDPTEREILDLQREFNINEDAVNQFLHSSKKPQIRIFSDQIFALVIDISYQNNQTILTKAIYIFQGYGWLITMHSSGTELFEKIKNLLERKNKKVIESDINALFYSILSILVDSYENLVMGVEIRVNDIESDSMLHPSKEIFQYINSLSRQLIILRRHFWIMRNVINYIWRIGKEDNKGKEQSPQKTEGSGYIINIVRDDMDQLIDTTEAHQRSLNSIRELMLSSIAIQQNDAMKVLTVFAAILLPITFVTGIFGMNGMDLSYLINRPIGEEIIFSSMILISLTLLFYFKRRRWVFQKHGHSDDLVRDIDKND